MTEGVRSAVRGGKLGNKIEGGDDFLFYFFIWDKERGDDFDLPLSLLKETK